MWSWQKKKIKIKQKHRRNGVKYGIAWTYVDMWGRLKKEERRYGKMYLKKLALKVFPTLRKNMIHDLKKFGNPKYKNFEKYYTKP